VAWNVPPIIQPYAEFHKSFTVECEHAKKEIFVGTGLWNRIDTSQHIRQFGNMKQQTKRKATKERDNRA